MYTLKYTLSLGEVNWLWNPHVTPSPTQHGGRWQRVSDVTARIDFELDIADAGFRESSYGGSLLQVDTHHD